MSRTIPNTDTSSVRGVPGTSIPTPLETLGSSIKLWLRADYGITQTGSGVSQWNDQSGNGNHAVQGTDAARPIYENIMGMPAVCTDAARYLTIPDAASLRLATGKAWGVYAAVRSSDGNNSVAVIGKWNATNEYACNVQGSGGVTAPTTILYIGASGGLQSSSASVDCTTGDETIVHWKLTTGGNVHAGSLGAWGGYTTISGTPNALTNTVYVGRFSPTLGSFVGAIREIIMYQKTSGDITRDEERAILTWLRSRWSTP
jgi:hypothetical protein